MNFTKLPFLSVLVFMFTTFSCCVHEKPGTKSVSSKPEAVPVVPLTINFISPSPNQIFTIGDKITINLKLSENAQNPDSIVFYLDGVKTGVISGSVSENIVESKGISPGIKRLRITSFFPEGKMENNSVALKFLSDVKPKIYTYRVLGSFPHDINAYTQGFEYHDGYFFEGTGQLGQSSIRKVVPGTGDVIKSRKISSDIFGEGITVLNGKIYQVTYRSQVGFVYDVESFEQLQKFFYPNLEGWGLTNNGREIIMSDGTNVIYFLDPQYFTVNRKIEVYDNVMAIDSLNELELVNGSIYANRYMTDEIVMIDPETGKITGKVDMKGLLKPGDRHPGIDVLNGIAWDKEQKRLFVTGKNWPKIYQMEFIEK